MFGLGKKTDSKKEELKKKVLEVLRKDNIVQLKDKEIDCIVDSLAMGNSGYVISFLSSKGINSSVYKETWKNISQDYLMSPPKK